MLNKDTQYSTAVGKFWTILKGWVGVVLPILHLYYKISLHEYKTNFSTVNNIIKQFEKCKFDS